MVSHIGSICEKCGSDDYKYIDKGLSKQQIIGMTFFISGALIMLSLFVGVLISALLILITIVVGITAALKANPRTITYCKKCKSEDTMHFIGSIKGRELYNKYYKDK